MKIMKYALDQILSLIQKRCKHPAEMVAVDILEGCVDGLSVSYCRRCGAIKTDWVAGNSKYMILDHTWRSPDPNLWR